MPCRIVNVQNINDRYVINPNFIVLSIILISSSISHNNMMEKGYFS